MAVVFKAEAIVPKGFDVGRIKREIEYVLEAEGIDDRHELAKTTEGWSSAPHMDYETKVKANEAWVWIGPVGSQELVDKWRRIDEGTAARGWSSTSVMVFPFQGVGQSYDAKTRPGHFGRAGTGEKKGPIRRTRRIRSHSIEARQWSQILGKKRIKPFAANIQAAIDRGLA
jgi:hypothetical protein